MDGRQTVPRAEMTAVIRALLHVKATGQSPHTTIPASHRLGGPVGTGRSHHPKGNNGVHQEGQSTYNR
eukprot:7524864-Karenia_brevis.AAC.1